MCICLCDTDEGGWLLCIIVECRQLWVRFFTKDMVRIDEHFLNYFQWLSHVAQKCSFRYIRDEREFSSLKFFHIYIFFSSTRSHFELIFSSIYTIEHTKSARCRLSFCSVFSLSVALSIASSKSFESSSLLLTLESSKQASIRLNRAWCEIEMWKMHDMSTLLIIVIRYFCRKRGAKHTIKPDGENHQTGTSQMKDVNNNEVVITIFSSFFYVYFSSSSSLLSYISSLVRSSSCASQRILEFSILHTFSYRTIFP